MSNRVELTDADRSFLMRCVELASAALESGDEPFGSVLVDGGGVELFADHNRVAGGDRTRHPEFEIVRWAAKHLTPEQRLLTTVYTSGEHCPMCAAAHGWVASAEMSMRAAASSSEQLSQWCREWGLPAGPVLPLPIQAIAPQITVAGPDPQLSKQIRVLHAKLHGRSH